ncbi:MAG: SUMF1/EgtB/PvdO family nonheme iron enzyme [Polyangiales bacterium]
MARRSAKKNGGEGGKRVDNSTTPAKTAPILPPPNVAQAESPTPTSFEVAAGRAEAEAAHEADSSRELQAKKAIEKARSLDRLIEVAPPSSRGAVVLDSLPPPGSPLAEVRPPSNKSAATRWLGIVATFLVVAVIVGEREDIARVLRRMKVPSPTSLFQSFTGATAAASVEDDGPCPVEMSLVESKDGAVRVCVDRFEASLVELGDDGKEQPFSPYLSCVTGGTPEERHRVKAVSRPNVVPQAYISRDEAEQACGEAGKRLCRADEWKVACGGPEATRYPYGDTEDTAACNTSGKAPLGELFPQYGAEIYDFRVMNDPSLNALPGTVALTASYARCANAYGLYDMVGNLHEWTAEKGGEFHGGYYLDSHDNGDGCGYVTTAHDATYHDYSTGFRCCLDADR